MKENGWFLLKGFRDEDTHVISNILHILLCTGEWVKDPYYSSSYFLIKVLLRLRIWCIKVNRQVSSIN